jgi:hypothetical protein
VTKITGNVVDDYRNATPEQREALLLKLRKYVARGEWAAQMLAEIAHIP